MPYSVSIVVALLTTAMVFLFGPLAVLPVAYWAVLGPEVPPNGRTAAKISINLVVVLIIAVSIAAWHTLALFVPARELHSAILEVSRLPVIKTNLVAYVQQFFDSGFGYGKSCSRCYSAYGMYLISLILLCPIVMYYASRLFEFRKLLAERTKGMHTKSNGKIIWGCILLIALLLFLSAPAYVFSENYQAMWDLPFRALNWIVSSGKVLLFFLISILLFAAVKRLIDTRTSPDHSKNRL